MIYSVLKNFTRNSRYKNTFLNYWIFFTNFSLNFARKTNKSASQYNIGINYVGGISGNSGGPQVKLLRLQKEFPSRVFNFNIAYALSNYSYLTEKSVKNIKKLNIPIVLNQNGVYHLGWAGKDFASKNLPNKLIYKNCDYVFWQSDFARKTARRFLDEQDPMGEVLYNAVDTSIFVPRKSPNRKFTFLIAGNFNNAGAYQIYAAIKSFKLVSKKSHSVKLIIAGLNTDLRKTCLNAIKEHGLTNKIEVLGSFSQIEAPELIQGCDAFLALKYMDTCPNSVIEAMSCGLPIVYSKTGGTPELVGISGGVGLELQEDFNSLPIAPDPSHIAEAMLQVMDKKNELSNGARLIAEKRFDIKHWIKRHNIVFRNLLQNNDRLHR